MIEMIQEKVKKVVETPVPLGYTVCAVALAILLVQKPVIMVMIAEKTAPIMRPV